MASDHRSNSNGNNSDPDFPDFKWDPLRFISKKPDEVLKKVDERLDGLEKEYFSGKKDK